MPESHSPYRILERKRAGTELSDSEIRSFVAGATDGSWDDVQTSAFLMATAIRGMTAAETSALTLAMLDSGERWALGEERAGLVDKHSTGGVGDKVSLVVAPLLAEIGVPMAKLTGRGLGHTGGTADKLESIPGFQLDLSRDRVLDLLDEVGIAVAIASRDIAPADKRLYALRNLTATVDCLPLVVGSILSKKLALGASTLIFDVKAGSGSFFSDEDLAIELGRQLVGTAEHLGTAAMALVTDMSQPLGIWSGNACEVNEALRCLEGDGNPRLEEIAIAIASSLCRRAGIDADAERLRAVLDSGAGRERFMRWARCQGADADALTGRGLPLAPVEIVATADRSGHLTAVDGRALGLLLLEFGAGRIRADDDVDPGVSLRYEVEIGQRIEVGDELVRMYLRSEAGGLEARLRACFEIGDRVAAPVLVRELPAP